MRWSAGQRRRAILPAVLVSLALASTGTSLGLVAAGPPTTDRPPPATLSGDSELVAGAAKRDPPAVGSCHFGQIAGHPVPDARCTPGTIDPAVSGGTASRTICNRAWIAANSYRSSPLTARIRAAYRAADADIVEPLVPVDLGGASADPANLWPVSAPEEAAKDHIEENLRLLVCAGHVPLANAQWLSAVSWPTVREQLATLVPRDLLDDQYDGDGGLS